MAGFDENKPLRPKDGSVGAAKEEDSCMDGCKDGLRKFFRGFKCKRGQRNDKIRDDPLQDYKFQRKVKGQMKRRKSIADV